MDSSTRSANPKPDPSRYRRLWQHSVGLTALVALSPLLILTLVNYFQYQRALQLELQHPTSVLMSNAKHSVESFIDEQLSSLQLLLRRWPTDRMCDANTVAEAFQDISSVFGGVVDLGVIDADGTQCAYAGPYDLLGKSYRNHKWFVKTMERGHYVTDVYRGYRDVPHFALSIRSTDINGKTYVLRTTAGAELLRRYTQSLNALTSTDGFIINHEGILQTPSKYQGKVLDLAPAMMSQAMHTDGMVEQRSTGGMSHMVAYMAIDRSPFILVMTRQAASLASTWFAGILAFLLISIVLIMVVTVWSTGSMVNRLQQKDLQREIMLHKFEHTNKMASIGRLAAGVAHEVNNPLAIINEKAGLIEDILKPSKDFAERSELLSIAQSIQASVRRCSAITHNLLDFARRIDIRPESIGLEALLRNVLTFLDKEAIRRGIRVNVTMDDPTWTIISDRGKLEQVFLNIINNAFAAVESQGRIQICVEKDTDARAVVRIRDNGHGISKEDLPHIFEPFFTKKEHGSGLGLSITYGIVAKLGGTIEVESEVGQGTCFTVTLPVNSVEAATKAYALNAAQS